MDWIRRSGMMLAGAAVAAAFGTAPVAEAGTYIVYGCAKPDGTPAPTEGWSVISNTAANVDLTSCSTGGPMRAELQNVQHAEGAFGGLVFTAPPGLPIVGYVLNREALVQQSSYGNYHYDLYGFNAADATSAPNAQRSPSDELCYTPCRIPDPPAETDFSTRNEFQLGGVRMKSMYVLASCAPDPNTVAGTNPEVCNPASGQTPAAAYIHRAQVLLQDDSDPEFTSPPAGTLFDTSRELNGRVSASFAAKDTGSGVYQAVIEVDGKPVATKTIDDNDGKCRKPFVARVPCKAGASTADTIELDTAVLPDGPHNVRLLVRDATETNEIPYGPVSITTRNSVPGRGTPNGINAADGALLTAGWKGRRSRVLRSRFGRRVAIVGKLRNPAGQPIVGATVVLAKTDLRLGAAEQQLATVTTRADGSFGHRFKARPGMAIVARYRAFAGDAGFSAQQGLTLRVRAAATLRAARTVKRGRRLRFSGRLRGGPIPRTGKLVVLQARVGRRWEDSKTVRTDRRGRFASSVPTRAGGGRDTVRLRVLVRREASYPYSTGTSRSRRVTLLP